MAVSDIGSEGDGIALIDGFVVVVPDTKIGDSVTVEIEMVRETFARGRVIRRHD